MDWQLVKPGVLAYGDSGFVVLYEGRKYIARSPDGKESKSETLYMAKYTAEYWHADKAEIGLA